MRTVLLTRRQDDQGAAAGQVVPPAGHRVVLVESAKYRWTGHRFSRAVDAFHCVPEPSDPGYAEALLDVVRRERVDVFVPVSSPAASVPDARARTLLDGVCDVLHAHADIVAALDDKSEFSRVAERSGCACPTRHRITDRPAGRGVRLPARAGPTSSSASPTTRSGGLDLTPLPGETPERNAAYARSLPISADDPWILQEFIPAASTAPTPPCATAASGSTAAASRRRSRSTTHRSTSPRSGTGSSISSRVWG